MNVARLKPAGILASSRLVPGIVVAACLTLALLVAADPAAAEPGFQTEPPSGSTVTLREGNTGSLRLRLAEAPTGDVNVTVRSSDTSALTVASSMLTFTASNYDTWRTVYLAAEQDGDKVSESVTVTLAASGGGYDDVEATRTYDVTDNDNPAIEVEQKWSWFGYGRLAVWEGDPSVAFWARLSQRPTGLVTVTVASDDTAVATASPGTLYFTPANWDRAQMIAVTATPDANTTDDVTDINLSASGGGYDSAGASKGILAKDAGVAAAIVFDRDWVHLHEDAQPTSFPVTLASAPSSDVTVTVTSGDTGALTVDADPNTAGNQGSFTFTTTNWNVPRRITVAAVQDADSRDETVDVTFAFGGQTARMLVRVHDAEDAMNRFTVAPAVVKMEEGKTAEVDIGLTNEPTADVTVSNWRVLGQGHTKDSAVSVSPATLTFTKANWTETQTVTLTAAEDADANNEGIWIIFDSSGGGFRFPSNHFRSFFVTVSDDEAAASSAGLVISPARLTLVEGTNGAVAVNLASKPSGNVHLVIDNNTDFPRRSGVTPVEPRWSAVFTPGNWNVPQTLSVGLEWYDGSASHHPLHGANDRTVEIELVGYKGAPEYVGVSGKVAMTAVPAGTAAFAASPDRLALAVGEAETFRVSLSRMPTGTVTVSAASSATDTATVGSSSLTFTAADWNIGQVLTVTGVAAGSANVNLSASGGGYGSATLAVPVAVSTGGASPGVSVGHERLLLKEGFSETFDVTLATRPAGAVTVGIASDNAGALTLSGASLSFTQDNWNTAQTVTVTANTDVNTDDDFANLTFTPTTTNYTGAQAATVAVHVIDEDAPTVVFSTPSVTTGNITATFSGAVSVGSTHVHRFWPERLKQLFTLKRDGQEGSDIGFHASINGNTVTLDPHDLPVGTVYVAVSDQYWSDRGVQGRHAHATFTVAAPPGGPSSSDQTLSALLDKDLTLRHVSGGTVGCLDVQWADAKDGQNVQTWECNGTNAQKWQLQQAHGRRAEGTATGW